MHIWHRSSCCFSPYFPIVHCKNTQLTLDDLHLNDLNWNNVANNGLMFNGRFLLPSNRATYKSRSYSQLSQPLNKPDVESMINLGKDQPMFNANTESHSRSRLDAFKYQPNTFALNNNPYARLLSKPLNLADRPTTNEQLDDKVISQNEQLRNVKRLFNRPSSMEDTIINRNTRSGPAATKTQSHFEYKSDLLNFLNRDLFQTLRRNFYTKNENSQEKQSEEIVDLFNGEPKNAIETDESRQHNGENKQDQKTKQVKKEDKSTSSKLITNNSNYQPVIEQQSQSLTKSRTLANPTSLRKNKWNRVSKSTSFLGNNVSDCIKNCVSQGILHPVQCHSLC